MSMKKQMSSKEMKTIDAATEKKPARFAKGRKFTLDNKLWIVLEEFEADNTPMRRVRADNGDEEIVTVLTLDRDVAAGVLVMVEDKCPKK